MKKTILSFLLIFTILFNTYSKPAYADPVTIGVTSYEVYTYITLILTYMGVEFKNAQERQRWIEDEYGTYTGNPDGGFYDIIDYQIRRAKADAKFGIEPPKPEPRQIAIPVPDTIIDSLYNKLKDLIKDEPSSEFSQMLNHIFSIISNNNTYEGTYRIYRNTSGNYVILAPYKYHMLYDAVPTGGTNLTVMSKVIPGYSVSRNWHFLVSIYKPDYTHYQLTTTQGYNLSESSLIYDSSPVLPTFEIILPTGNFNLNWTSPYTGMQTVTMPYTNTGTLAPIEIPLIPDYYVEPVPDEVTNPITQPVTDPLINPETGLPFLDPETGLPIFPSTPLVPSVPVTPVPAPETLTQPKDYTPNLTEISNGIKQLPERIINPIKKLFIPDTVSKIDFSPLNVPITKKFPFCIPWDLRDAVVSFSAPPVPPVFTFSLTFFGDEYPIVWDFAIFDEFAEITRFFVLIGFVVGLILATRGLIKG